MARAGGHHLMAKVLLTQQMKLKGLQKKHKRGGFKLEFDENKTKHRALGRNSKIKLKKINLIKLSALSHEKMLTLLMQRCQLGQPTSVCFCAPKSSRKAKAIPWLPTSTMIL